MKNNVLAPNLSTTASLPLTGAPANLANLLHETGAFWGWGLAPEQVRAWVEEVPEWEEVPASYDVPGMVALGWRRTHGEPVVAEFIFKGGQLTARRYLVPAAEAPATSAEFQRYMRQFIEPGEMLAAGEDGYMATDLQRCGAIDCTPRPKLGQRGGHAFFVAPTWAAAREL